METLTWTDLHMLVFIFLNKIMQILLSVYKSIFSKRTQQKYKKDLEGTMPK